MEPMEIYEVAGNSKEEVANESTKASNDTLTHQILHEEKVGNTPTTHESSIESIYGKLQHLSGKLEGISSKFSELEKLMKLIATKFEVWEASQGPVERETNPYAASKLMETNSNAKVTPKLQKCNVSQDTTVTSMKQKNKVACDMFDPGSLIDDYNNAAIDISDDEDGHGLELPAMNLSQKNKSVEKQKTFTPIGNSFLQLEKMKSQSYHMESKKSSVLIDRTKAIGDPLVPRRLPYPAEPKRPKLEPKLEPNLISTCPVRNTSTMGPNVSQVSKGKLTYLSNTRAQQKAKGSSTQKKIQTRFNPTEEMNLSSKEIHLAAYMFRNDTDMSETIFKIGKVTATLEHFDCLNPERIVEPELINLMAAKINCIEQRNRFGTTWSLPLTFERHVRNGLKVEKILGNYLEDWLHPYADLKYIYIPINEGVGHIYLIVIAIEEHQVYYFDSYVDDHREINKQMHMREACEMIHQITSDDKFTTMPYHGKVDAHKWEVVEVQGIEDPGELYDYNSPIWVMDWVSMGSSFQASVQPRLNEKVVRMKIGVHLVAGEHNECWAELDDKVEKYWEVIKSRAMKK